MSITPINPTTDNFGILYNVLNSIISLWNNNDASNLNTASKTSLVSAINEVNSKKLPFYLKDSNLKINISLEA